MPSVAETVAELIQWVFPEHAGAPGQIHGGRMRSGSTQGRDSAAARWRGARSRSALWTTRLPPPGPGGESRSSRPGRVTWAGPRSSRSAVWSEKRRDRRAAVTLNSHLGSSRSATTGGRGRSRQDHAPDPAEQDLVEPRAGAGRRAWPLRQEGRAGEGSTTKAGPPVRFESARSVCRGRALWPHDVRGQAAEGHRRGRGILSMRYCRASS